MCGIVGMYTAASPGFAFKDKEVFQQMLYADALRGFHSTGVLIGDFGKINEQSFVKLANIPNVLMGTDEYKEEISNKFFKMHFAVGHNRYATKGKVSNENAHPFEVGPIILVHNGTIHNEHEIGAGTWNNVDSHRVAMKLAELSPEEGPELFSSLAGGFAFVWTDTRNQSLNIIRNELRPLFFTTDKKDGYMYFASEAGLLSWILTRNDVEHAEPREFRAWRLCTFKNGTMKLETRDIEKYKAPPYTPPKGGTGSKHYHNQYYNDWETEAYESHYQEPSKVVNLTPNKPPAKSGGGGLVADIHSKCIKLGSRIVFQLEDYDIEIKVKRKQNFVPIKGLMIGYDNIQIRGNTTIDIMTILDSCNLLSGEISQVRTVRGENTLIVDVKEIKLTNIKDPDVPVPEEMKPKQKPILLLPHETPKAPEKECGFGGACKYDDTGLLCDACLQVGFKNFVEENTIQ